MNSNTIRKGIFVHASWRLLLIVCVGISSICFSAEDTQEDARFLIFGKYQDIFAGVDKDRTLFLESLPDLVQKVIVLAYSDASFIPYIGDFSRLSSIDLDFILQECDSETSQLTIHNFQTICLNESYRKFGPQILEKLTKIKLNDKTLTIDNFEDVLMNLLENDCLELKLYKKGEMVDFEVPEGHIRGKLMNFNDNYIKIGSKTFTVIDLSREFKAHFYPEARREFLMKKYNKIKRKFTEEISKKNQEELAEYIRAHFIPRIDAPLRVDQQYTMSDLETPCQLRRRVQDVMLRCFDGLVKKPEVPLKEKDIDPEGREWAKKHNAKLEQRIEEAKKYETARIQFRCHLEIPRKDSRGKWKIQVLDPPCELFFVKYSADVFFQFADLREEFLKNQITCDAFISQMRTLFSKTAVVKTFTESYELHDIPCGGYFCIACTVLETPEVYEYYFWYRDGVFLSDGEVFFTEDNLGLMRKVPKMR